MQELPGQELFCFLDEEGRPKVRFSRAYSLLPTRIRVVSSSRTTSASTRSRPSPRSASRSSTALRMRGNAMPNASMRSNLAQSRTSRQRGW